MATNLYSRLFRCQSRGDRSNLENFLTEILCDYLNRLEADQPLSFVRNVLLFGLHEERVEAWASNCANVVGEAVWRSQHPISWEGTTKYPDLMYFYGGKPLVLVEVKIWAQFTQRTTLNQENETLTFGQLQDYGNWLNSVNPSGAMILLSHGTQAPRDFLAADSIYGIPNRNIASWQRVYNWLGEVLKCSNAVPCITSDFMAFLREMNMAHDPPKHSDFSVFELFVNGPGLRIGNSFSYTRQALQERFPQGVSWGAEVKALGEYQYRIDYERKVVWSWAVLADDEYSYVGWGLIFPDDVDVWDLRRSFGQLPKEPFLFLTLASSGQTVQARFKETRDARPSDWSWAQDDSVAGDYCPLGLIWTPLSPLLAYDADFTSQFSEWVSKHFAEASDFFQSLRLEKETG